MTSTAGSQSPISTWVLRPLAAVAVSAAALMAPQTAGLAAAAPGSSCPDVEVVFARGTFEAPGVGATGQAFVDALTAQLPGKTVDAYGVNYPASLDFQAAAQGVGDAGEKISSTVASCPDTKIVLGGYSQGAAVVDMLAGVPPLGNRIGDIGSAPPLPGGLTGNVAAVAVFGNPSAKFGSPLSGSGSFAGKALDLCADGDPICSDGRNPFAHTHYESSPFIGQAAGFAAGRV